MVGEPTGEGTGVGGSVCGLGVSGRDGASWTWREDGQHSTWTDDLCATIHLNGLISRYVDFTSMNYFRNTFTLGQPSALLPISRGSGQFLGPGAARSPARTPEEKLLVRTAHT